MTAVAARRARGRRGEAGFTLMEMLVVLVIIGLIAAVAIPQVLKLLESAKHKAARIQIETIIQGLQYYQLDIGQFPSTAEGLGALWMAPAGVDDWNGPYVRREKQLVDPWGNKLIYTSPGKERRYDLMSLGADAKIGGKGDDADIIAD
jgi:general secretion pathway protein G